MPDALYFSDVALGPKPTQVEWAEVSGGKRIRLVCWKGGKKGTVFIFQGRTEYVEKYGAVAEQFLNLGYSVVTCDWRGQGLSDRYPRHYQIGEVDAFSDYQIDVEAMMDFARRQKTPKPYFALGHSLGGGILLRSLHNGLDVKGAMFSAPMWGILLPFYLKPFTALITSLYQSFGWMDALAPGRNTDNYVEVQPFKGNVLTNDTEEYMVMRKQIMAHRELGLAGPSMNWANLAIQETLDLQSLSAPSHPALTLYAGDEKIVDNGAIEAIVAGWSSNKGVKIAGAEHEVLMETPERRAQCWSEIEAFLNA
ncbi:MAG: alpha/beta hydrolase [Pseudomonadota bacterium]